MIKTKFKSEYIKTLKISSLVLCNLNWKFNNDLSVSLEQTNTVQNVAQGPLVPLPVIIVLAVAGSQADLHILKQLVSPLLPLLTLPSECILPTLVRNQRL